MAIPALSPLFSERFFSRVDKTPDCWLWKGARDPDGYGRCSVSKKIGIQLAHRISWSIERGPIPEGICVLHSCDNPPCVRPDHLFLGTQLDNVRDMLKKLRNPKTAVLDPKQVSLIRELYKTGQWSYSMLASEFKICKSQVCNIITAKQWRFI